MYNKYAIGFKSRKLIMTKYILKIVSSKHLPILKNKENTLKMYSLEVHGFESHSRLILKF